MKSQLSGGERMPKLRLISAETLEQGLKIDILSLVGDAVICTDESGRILVFNQAAEQCFGYCADEVIGKEVGLLLPQRYRSKHGHEVLSFAHGSGSAVRPMGARREVMGRRKNGEEFPVEASISRNTIDGKTILTAVNRDITERKELEVLREAVAHELDHRMKNVLSIVTSLISLSAANAVNVDEFKTSLIGRVAALAKSQSAFRFGDEKQLTNLADLLRLELAQYQAADGTNLVIEGAPAFVSPKAAQLLALAVHELATNSVKYGALGSAGGRVTVNFTFIGEGDASKFAISWREAGGPPVKPPTSIGFGTTLIKRVVARALRAEVAIEYPRQGLICHITCPRTSLEAD